MSLEVEDKIRDTQERYRTLSMYDIEVGITELSFYNTNSETSMARTPLGL